MISNHSGERALQFPTLKNQSPKLLFVGYYSVTKKQNLLHYLSFDTAENNEKFVVSSGVRTHVMSNSMSD